MKKYFLFGTLVYTLLIFGCKNNNHSEKKLAIDPLEAAKPHGESLPFSELSDADKLRLGNAKGITASPISKNEMDSLFLSSKNMLHIFSFFKKDSLASLEMNETVFKIQKEVGEDALNVVLFSLDAPNKLVDINSYIRQKGVTSEVYFSSDTLNGEWYSKIHSNWSGEVPAIYLVNQSDGTNLFYQKKFSFDELLALLQPFIM